MQVRIMVGTIAFMLTMVIVGFAALREPARMEHFAAAEVGRSIESGAVLFKNNCATCHGVNGEAKECYDGEGNAIGCKGLPLNNRALVCGEPSKRMEDMQWLGSKFAFVQGTITSGRPWNGMPTWGQDFGGPLVENEVKHLARYVLNWETEDFCKTQLPEFPWPGNHPDAYETFIGLTTEDIPEGTVQLYVDNDMPLNLPVTVPGDAERGAELFAITYGCSACHGIPEDVATGSPGPGPHLAGIKDKAPTLIDGFTAEEYIYQSILNPAAFITTDCPTGDCTNGMPNNFGSRMSENPQDLIDIMTHLLEN